MLVASLPLTSYSHSRVASRWYGSDRDRHFIAPDFWLVLPSLILFLVLPVLLERGLAFLPSPGISTLATVGVIF